MNSTNQSGTDLQQVLEYGRRHMTTALSGPPWLTAVRERGAAAASTMALPSRKEEAWRYTSLDFLAQAEFRPLVGGPFDAIGLDDIEELLLNDSDALRLPFVNGYLARALLPEHHHLDGITITNLGSDLGEPPETVRRKLDAIAEHRHLFAALNTALMSDGALIHVPAGMRSTRAIEILNITVGMDDPFIAHPRHLIVLDEDARIEVIERYCTTGEGVYFNNALIEVALGAGSELIHERLQEESPDARHLSDLIVRLGERSRYRLTQAAFGGAWSRTDIRVSFEGEHAEAQIAGLLLAGGRQLNDIHLDVQHKVQNCTSRQAFKSVLDGKGRVVVDGHIMVAEGAQKTDAVLANDNLILSRSAEVDTKPQLEIYADDVKCSHGTTVGELDGDMLFYLRSRGIPAAHAKRMLCQGFADEIVATIVHPALRTRVGERLAARLEASL